MNGKELRIYTLLTHPTKPESYHISDDGRKLYVIEDGGLMYLEGDDLDQMSERDLFSWYQSKINWLRFNL